jgi:hypothetical protein
MRWRLASAFEHKRIMFPVLGGISGSNKTILNI